MSESGSKINKHKAGFVTIAGKPNVGKSTLMNQLVGEKLSIITSKAQTTRHRILGIISGDDFQVVYSDTPGILNPKYELHKSMMKFVSQSVDDADLILFVTDLYEKFNEEPQFHMLSKGNVPVIMVINKIDLAKEGQIEQTKEYWKKLIQPQKIIEVSALNGVNIDLLFQEIINFLPEHPAYYPKEEMTNKPERFFVAEIIREKIFQNYKKEIPYSCEVNIEEFKEDENIIRIRAIIYVERKSQRGILLGHKGERMKKVGIASRMDIENFFGKKVFLEQYIKVEPDWRKNPNKLNRFGYN